MSDRFVLHASKESIESEFGVSTERDDYFEPNYNITPGTRLPVVFTEDGNRRIHAFKWGMIPEGAEAEKEGLKWINLPAERLYRTGDHENDEDASLGEAFEDRRCIIPASGFYKWKTGKKKSTPFYIRLLSSDLMGLAGVYSVWQSESGRDVYSFSILTTEANALVQPVDDRMPVILRPEHYDVWLGAQKVDADMLEALLKPYLLTEMAVNRVSEKVNKPGNNGPELIQPIPK